jgi:hypothetical protein
MRATVAVRCTCAGTLSIAEKNIQFVTTNVIGLERQTLVAISTLLDATPHDGVNKKKEVCAGCAVPYSC